MGSAAMAVARKEVRVESFHDKTDLANHLVGGALMGFGGVTAMGCSIGQGISGLSLQSMGAVLRWQALFAVPGLPFVFSPGNWIDSLRGAEALYDFAVSIGDA